MGQVFEDEIEISGIIIVWVWPEVDVKMEIIKQVVG